MRKSLVYVLVLALFISVLAPVHAADQTAWDGTVATGFSGGDGTVSSPYLIKEASELAYLATLDKSSATANTKNKYYKLISDIDLNNVAWNPIMYFRGHFDGNGYTVSNLMLGDAKTSLLGLFAYNYGTITDLTIENVSVNAALSNKYMGAFCYTNNGTIEFCKLSGDFKMGTQYGVGGIVYTNSSNGIVRYSSVCDANMTGKAKYFGTIAYTTKGELYQCTVSNVDVDIDEKCANIGGVAGTASSTISDVHVYDLNMTIRDFAPSTTGCFGGIVGSAQSAEIKNCTISSSALNAYPNTYIHYFGGIAGELSGGKCTGCISDAGLFINEGVNTWYHAVGGIAGYATQSAVIENSISKSSFAMGTTTSATNSNSLYIGGICGYNSSWAYTKNCVSDSSINSLISGSRIGYIIGNKGSTTDSYDCWYNSSNVLSGGITTSQYAGTAVSDTEDKDFLKNTVGLSQYSVESTDDLAVWHYRYDTYPEVYSCYNKCVTYSANGGEGEPDSQFIEFLSGDALSSQVPIKENYKFKQWNTKADGSGTAYAAGDDISSLYTDGFIKLYAIWEEAQPSAVPTITQAQGYKVCTVKATNIPENAYVIVAFYKGEKMVLARVMDVSMTANIPDSVVYDNIKTFVWDDGMKPLC